jgi:beta-glucanase (GH16 family)
MIGTDATRSFQYGKFSARIKFQEPKGAHGSFWLQSPGTEVDTIEYFGKAGDTGGGLRSYVHRPRVVNGQTKFVTSGGPLKASRVRQILGNHRPSDGYHTYTVVWTPSSYVFSIDGQQTLKITNGVSSTPVALVLSLLSSYYELPALKHARLPVTMQVDWVKVWQKSRRDPGRRPDSSRAPTISIHDLAADRRGRLHRGARAPGPAGSRSGRRRLRRPVDRRP